MRTQAATSTEPGAIWRMPLSSAVSYSSTISPTICSRTSSIVTSPATPPYSSRTMAMWTRRRFMLSRSLSMPVVSGM